MAEVFTRFYQVYKFLEQIRMSGTTPKSFWWIVTEASSFGSATTCASACGLAKHDSINHHSSDSHNMCLQFLDSMHDSPNGC